MWVGECGRGVYGVLGACGLCVGEWLLRGYFLCPDEIRVCAL